jgi:enoyl-CoA hydratase/carnithine racemase
MVSFVPIPNEPLQYAPVTFDSQRNGEVCLKGHETFKKIRSSKIPIVAAINGPALGGGLEVCLYT